MFRLFAVWIPVLAVLTSTLLTGCERRSDGVDFVRIASGPAGGALYPLGARIAQVLQLEIDTVSATTLPGGGEANVRDLQKGTAELALTYSYTAHEGYYGLGQFSERTTNVRHFATLYPATFQAAVRRESDILSYSDLSSSNISPGKAGWVGTAVAQQVLEAHGITFESLKKNGATVNHVDYADSVALMKDGHIDSFMAMTLVPSSSFMDVNFQLGIRLLPIEPEKIVRLLEANPTLIKMTIPKGAYEGMSSDVLTVGAMTVLLVRADLSEDLVYRMTEVFWENGDRFAEVVPVWRDVKVENALQSVTIPVHPGAQRYYDERRVMADYAGTIHTEP